LLLRLHLDFTGANCNTRQFLATSGQFADAVIRQITQTPADNQAVSNAVQAGTAALQADSPDARVLFVVPDGGGHVDPATRPARWTGVTQGRKGQPSTAIFDGRTL
jgi:hypothetical protein